METEISGPPSHIRSATLRCRRAWQPRPANALAKESDPEILKQYETLWGLEFRSRSPQQHAALRRQVAEDLKRLESANPKPDGEWLAFLKGGYKQSGAAEAVLTAFDDRILKEFPSLPSTL